MRALRIERTVWSRCSPDEQPYPEEVKHTICSNPRDPTHYRSKGRCDLTKGLSRGYCEASVPALV